MSIFTAYPSNPTSAGKNIALQSNRALFSPEKLAAYKVLCRPRIAVMTALSVAVGYTLGSERGTDPTGLIFSVAGIVLFVASSSILNQLLERRTDALMERTQNRPLVSGVVSPGEAWSLGVFCSLAGFCILAFAVNLITALASLVTMLLYVCCYTPLKRVSVLCTTVGAIPGAMPPVLGWLASGSTNYLPAFALFAVFFVWQFPHFLAIAWIYRHQYELAGLKMLPSNASDGRTVGLIAVLYAAVFVTISVLPRYAGISGDGYMAAALILSLGYLVLSFRFALLRTITRAKQLMLGSLLCLSVMLFALMFDYLRLTS